MNKIKEYENIIDQIHSDLESYTSKFKQQESHLIDLKSFIKYIGINCNLEINELKQE